MESYVDTTNELLEKLRTVLDLPEKLIELKIELSLDVPPQITYKTFIEKDIIKK